jgi:hypothetical protein
MSILIMSIFDIFGSVFIIYLIVLISFVFDLFALERLEIGFGLLFFLLSIMVVSLLIAGREPAALPLDHVG